VNQQFKGERKRGIEWTDYTWNPVGGCKHQCRWLMPDGQIAECYAKTVAESEPVRGAFPAGFEHHYWRPGLLSEPAELKRPSMIFIDSMSDLFAADVPMEQTREVLRACEAAPQHIFQVLTKAPNRLMLFEDDMPKNLWVGVSSPPDWFMGKQLTEEQRNRFFLSTLRVLHVLKESKGLTVWMSFEPLSDDVGRSLALYHPLDWAVIGAASNGPVYYQPNPQYVRNLLYVLDKSKTPVFFKGNLRETWVRMNERRREDFPRLQHPALDNRQRQAMLNEWPRNESHSQFEQGRLF